MTFFLWCKRGWLIDWCPVSIQTQLLALRKRKPQETQGWQAANHGCHCFDRAFLLAGACVCCVKFSRNKRKRQQECSVDRSSGNHDWLFANASACVSCGFSLRNARNSQAIAFEWKPGLTVVDHVSWRVSQRQRQLKQFVLCCCVYLSSHPLTHNTTHWTTLQTSATSYGVALRVERLLSSRM